jgi:hypothetical protein
MNLIGYTVRREELKTNCIRKERIERISREQEEPSPTLLCGRMMKMID